MSHARQHFQRVAAAQASAQAATTHHPLTGTAYELMLAQLDADRRRLKQIQSRERKIEAKRDMLPAYAAWVSGVLESASGVQDDVVMSVLVWRIDVGDLQGALDIAAYALAHDLLLPDQYERTLGCLLAEEFAEGAFKAMKAGSAADVPALESIHALTLATDMPDEVRAKLLKAIGLGSEPTDPDKALVFLQQALTLHDGAGVKKDIERLQRRIKNSAIAPTGDG